MAVLDERLVTDLKAAMRAGDTVRRDVIRYLRAGLQNARIERGHPLTDAEEGAVLKQQIKQRHEAIEQFQAGHRADLVARESAQLEVLNDYLPAGLDPAQLEALAREVIAETGASGPRDLGRVMPTLIARAAGRADNRALSDAARRLLAAG
ncbi:MAG TPA: GatB/YqeY domain-containing protein [Thermomicrobiales bacterium]|nr:GatB/YqeY domain-containing protein [Thermomicrobiales bacterium]